MKKTSTTKAEAGSASDGRDPRARRIIAWLRGALVVIGFLPWVLPVARSRWNLGDFGIGIDQAFLSVCHRRPARTMSLFEVPMPLCSRCAGIFLGLAIGAIVARPLLTPRVWRWIYAAACALMLAEIATQDLGLHPVWHPSRIATGLIVGYLSVIGALALLRSDRAPGENEGTRAKA